VAGFIGFLETQTYCSCHVVRIDFRHSRYKRRTGFYLYLFYGVSFLRERGHWGDQDVDGRIILGGFLKKVGGGGSWGLNGVGSG
jgi:hypothetical protein